MTNLIVRGSRRGVTLLAVFAAFALLAVASSRLVAQAAGAGATQRAAAAGANDQDRWEAAIKKFEDGDKVNPPLRDAIVFIGASSIVRWNLPDSFPELGAKAIKPRIRRLTGGRLDAIRRSHCDSVQAEDCGVLRRRQRR